MPLSFNCPQCGKSYSNVSDEFAGKRMKCACGKVMRLGGSPPQKSTPVAPVQPKAVPVKPVQPKPVQKAQPVQPVTPKVKPVKPVAVQPVKNEAQPVQPVTPKPVQPVTAQPAQPVAPKPVQPAAPQPVQPVAPIPIQPLAPINDVVDPIFGSGQKIDPEPTPDLMGLGDINAPQNASNSPDLFGSMQPDPTTNAAYAPPAPIARPQPRRVRRRSNKSQVGPIMSIISGALGLMYGLTCLLFSGSQMVVLIAALASTNQSLRPESIFMVIFAVISLLLSLAVTGGCGYSGITGILELANDYRNPGPSQTAGTACIAFTGMTLIGFIIAVVMAIALQANVGSVQYNEANVLGMIIGFLIVFIILMMLLTIPIFVFFVGHFRNRT